MDDYLLNKAPEVLDRYALLRQLKVHIYDEKTIKDKKGKIDAEWMKFSNAASLEACKVTTDPAKIRSMVLDSWNNDKRFEVYLKQGKEFCRTFGDVLEDVDPFEKYEQASKAKREELKAVVEEIAEYRKQHTTRTSGCNVSRQDLKNLNNLIESKTKEQIQLEKDLKKIATNWSQSLGKMRRKGPKLKKKKPGKKSPGIQFKTSHQLRKEAKEKKQTAKDDSDSSEADVELVQSSEDDEEPAKGKGKGKKSPGLKEQPGIQSKKSDEFRKEVKKKNKAMEDDSEWSEMGVEDTQSRKDEGKRKMSDEEDGEIFMPARKSRKAIVSTDEEGESDYGEKENSQQADKTVDQQDMNGSDDKSDNEVKESNDILDTIDITELDELQETQLEEPIPNNSSDGAVLDPNLTNWSPDAPNLWVIKTNVTQMTAEIGSSACIGIALKTVEKFLNGHLLLPFNKEEFYLYQDRLTMKFCTIVEEMKTYWDLLGLGLIAVNEATKLPIFSECKFSFRSVVWHSKIAVESWYSDALEALEDTITNNMTHATGLVLTTTERAFAVLISPEGDGTVAIFESHIHYNNEEMSFEEAIVIPECRGRIILATYNDVMELCKYVTETMFKEMRMPNTDHGNIEVVSLYGANPVGVQPPVVKPVRENPSGIGDNVTENSKDNEKAESGAHPGIVKTDTGKQTDATNAGDLEEMLIADHGNIKAVSHMMVDQPQGLITISDQPVATSIKGNEKAESVKQGAEMENTDSGGQSGAMNAGDLDKMGEEREIPRDEDVTVLTPDTKVSTIPSFVQQSVSQSRGKAVKQKVKNSNLKRYNRRVETVKNSFFNDMNFCQIPWDQCGIHLAKQSQHTSLHIQERLKSYGLLSVYHVLEQKGILPLRAAHEIYATNHRKEFLFLKEHHPALVANIKEQVYSYKSSNARDLLQKNMPVVLVYGSECTHVVPRENLDWDRVNEAVDMIKTGQVVSKAVDSLSSVIKQAMMLVTTSQDRNVLKFILTKLTSRHHMVSGKVGMKFNSESLREANIQTSMNMEEFEKESKGLTASQKNKLKQRLAWKARLPGSGRIFKCEEYAELVEIMVSLFDSESGDGFSAHPRLICETMYLERRGWMNMPRVMCILQQQFGIEHLALSTLYSYTENYRSKSKQAQRHHEGKGVNPKICLKRSTRDGQHKQSIDSHYCAANMKYSIQQMLDRGGRVIARDDKALVNTNVEVVQRPSKSWKPIQYPDHHWEKDTNRAVCITTYQLVEQATSKGPPGKPTALSLQGQGISIVKSNYFCKETALRHLNETLYLLSLPSLKRFFMKEGNEGPELITELLITVDNGPDEKPNSKLTTMLLTLMKLILDLDRVKTASYAPKDSKRHSVERYHVAENYALSQLGVISSYAVYASELTDGLFDEQKFRENMNHAVQEAVKRIQGTFHGGYEFLAFEAPSEADWVISPDVYDKLSTFVKLTSDQSRVAQNFIIRPEGPIWERICEIYDIYPAKAFSAYRIWNEVTDLNVSWPGRYMFSTYRKDDSWRGDPCKRYEISPVLDITSTRGAHYVSVDKAEELDDSYNARHDVEKPTCFRSPDFFLPSKNIDRAFEQDPKILHDKHRIDNLCQMLGITHADIRAYIMEKEEKIEYSDRKQQILDKFEGTLGTLLNDELKFELSKLGVVVTRQQSRKADLIELLDKELTKNGTSIDEFMEQYQSDS